MNAVIKNFFFSLNIISGVLFIFFTLVTCDSKPSVRYTPDSSGNINTVNVVMTKTNWEGDLGKKVRSSLGETYEGLPIDEPQFSFKYLEPKIFNAGDNPDVAPLICYESVFPEYVAQSCMLGLRLLQKYMALILRR